MMNEMGVWQRSWCIFVTFALLTALSILYTESGREADRALKGPEGQTVRAAVQPLASKPKPANVRLIRATVLPDEAYEKVPAADKKHLKPKPKTSVPAQAKSSIPVLAPAPEQIIRTLKVTATGYTAGYESTGKTPSHPEYGITYSGVKVRRDKNAVSTIAADPKVLPMGSILYVPGYGYAVVADTGSAIKGRKIDLYFATTKQVYKEWGKKTVEVQLIKRGGGKCTEAMLNSLSRAIQAYDTVPQEMLQEIV